MRRDAAGLLERLRSRGLSLAVAESCTGGLLGGALTEIPGSSEVFVGGITAYANTAKRALLGVPDATLRRYGAVSAPVARAMAAGARRRLGASCALSVTGVAGPGGGTRTKPVGLVFIAAALPATRARSRGTSRGRGAVLVQRFRFRGTRAEIRRQAVASAIALLAGAPGLERPRARSRPRSGSSGRARPR